MAGVASSTEIERLSFFQRSSGATEIWFHFSAERHKKLMKLLFDDALRKFRVVVDRKVVCTFEWDVSATIGNPGVCIRLHDAKEARRILDALRGPRGRG